MASGQLSRAEALACSGCRHACHVMLHAPTRARLFGRVPIRHLVLMQMRFDGLLGFPGGLVDPSRETLEEGLSRELLEELGVGLSVSVEDHVSSCYAPTPPSSSPSSSSSSPSSSSSSSSSPSPPPLITHFYVKRIEEEQVAEVERAAASTAADHGLEVLGMVRVPLYTLAKGGGLPCFLSHAFIGSARSQLLGAVLRLHMSTPAELQRALALAAQTQQRSAHDLQTALSLGAPTRARAAPPSAGPEGSSGPGPAGE